jgi:hypothetical protein
MLLQAHVTPIIFMQFSNDNFHSEVLRRNEVFVLTYVDRILPAKTAQLLRNSSSLRSQSDLSLSSSDPEPNFQRVTGWVWL